MELALRLGELVGLGSELIGLADQVGELVLDASMFGLEGGDHVVGKQRAPVALNCPHPFVDERCQSTAPLAQGFHPGKGLEPCIAGGRELSLEGGDADVELADRRAEVDVFLGQLRPSHRGCGVSLLERLELTTGEMQLQLAQLDQEIAVAASGLRLLLEGSKLAADFPLQVLQAGEIGLGGVEAALCPLLAPAVLEDPRRLLDDDSSVLGAGVEHLVDLTLGHDDVLLASDAGVTEQLLHVQQAARHPVEGVLRIAAAVEGAGDGHLVELHGQQTRRVVDHERHLGSTQRRPLGRTGEQHVVHLL